MISEAGTIAARSPRVTLESLNAKYAALFELLGPRKQQVLAFREYIERETAWQSAPASTRFHLNIERGLLLHSVGVAYAALDLGALLAPDITQESIIIAALFHDLGKVGYPGTPYYLPNQDRWQVERRGITHAANPEAMTMTIAVRSLYLIGSRIELTECEAQAIVACSSYGR